MNVSFEPDFQKKILYVSFPEGASLATPADIQAWRQAWMEALKLWHSPYKALISCEGVLFAGMGDKSFEQSLQRMFSVLKSLFLKKASAYGLKAPFPELPFSVFATEAEAAEDLGIRERDPSQKGQEDFRSLIQLENHFEQQVVELSFAAPVSLDKEKIAILKSKLTNNLMQWHSRWNLLVDCSQLDIPKEWHQSFGLMERFFKGFFLGQMIGYNNKDKEAFPFPVYRVRHKAAAVLKGEDVPASGRDAHCRSSKS